MIWLTWRQYRVQAVVALAALAVVAAALLITGLQMRATYDSTVGGCGSDCEAAKNAFVTQYNVLSYFATSLLIAVPGLMGIFWGAPLIARELETGTHRLIWNQSISRTRWLAVKLAAVGLVALAVTGLLSALVTWWASPLDQVNSDRFTPLVFDGRGLVPLAYAAFAFTAGAAARLVIRRTVPAMAATLVLFVAVQILVPYAIRPHFMTPERTEVALSSLGGQGGEQEWSAQQVMLSGDGESAQVTVGLMKAGTWVTSGAAPVRDAEGQEARGAEGCALREIDPMGCFAASDLRVEVAYQPADRYWAFQWIETGLFLALSGLLAGFCAWWLRRRTT